MTTRKLALSFTNHERAVLVFDYAFEHPEIQFIITPKDQQVAKEWLRENAYLRHFGWGNPDKHPPMKCGELVHLDELYYRDRCGYAGEDYTCTHPEEGEEDEDGRRLCFSSCCPIASAAYCADFKEKDPDLYKEYNCDEDEEEASDEASGEWMILYARPREAFVENITVLGLEQRHGMWRERREEVCHSQPSLNLS